MKLFRKYSKKKIFIIVLLLLVLLAGAELYGSNECLTVSRYKIADSKIEKEVRMVILADLHNHEFGKDNQRLLACVKKETPDLILCVGDFVNGGDENTEVAEQVVQELCKIAPVYVSLGNHEVEHENRFGTDLVDMFETCGAKVLEYEYEDVEFSGQTLRIGGLYGYCVPAKYLASKEANEQECAFLEDFMNTENYTLFLCHMPCMWTMGEALEEWKIDLVVSGHSHGGQIRFPLIGGLYAPDEGWFPGKTCGTYISEDGEQTMVLSRGLGSAGRIPRIYNIPEVVVVDLKSKDCYNE